MIDINTLLYMYNFSKILTPKIYYFLFQSIKEKALAVWLFYINPVIAPCIEDYNKDYVKIAWGMRRGAQGLFTPIIFFHLKGKLYFRYFYAID